MMQGERRAVNLNREVCRCSLPCHSLSLCFQSSVLYLCPVYSCASFASGCIYVFRMLRLIECSQCKGLRFSMVYGNCCLTDPRRVSGQVFGNLNNRNIFNPFSFQVVTYRCFVICSSSYLNAQGSTRGRCAKPSL